MRTRWIPAATALTVVLGVTGCGVERGAQPKSAPSASKAPQDEPNGVEKLDGKSVIDRAREAIGAAQTMRRTYTPKEAASEKAPAYTSDVVMATGFGGCTVKYDFGERGRTEAMVLSDRRIWVRSDRTMLERDHGADTAERFVGKYIADEITDAFTYYKLLLPCDTEGLLGDPEEADSVRYTKQTPTTVRGVRVLPVELTTKDARSTVHVALDGKPYPMRTTWSGAPYTLDYRFDEPFAPKAPPTSQTVPMKEFAKAVGAEEEPHWEVGIG
ncbi:hypothetical protein [Streptomyces sp. NBC_01304]|uniref:hypothetical protein n=1 Tax=Streptomyces sp. NBC_01304 TaxID=2903818 RepID=UPI002E133911|nr:hypothetical protein OG430_25390 [Streptomyces sp. NBC_01304]